MVVEVKFALILEHTILEAENTERKLEYREAYYLKLSMMDSSSEKSLQKKINLQVPAFHSRANRER